MEDSQNEPWGDLFVEYSIHNHPQAEQLVGILDQARIDHFGVQVAFQAQYQQVEFQNELRMQTQGDEALNIKSSRRRYRSFLKKPENYPHEYIMELGRQEVQGKIFMHVFQEDIGRIESQNGYKIFVDRHKLRIFMREGCEFSMLTKNKLLGMRDQLKIYHSNDQGLVVKLSKSKKLRQELQKIGITAWFKWYRMREIGYFFSIKMLVAEIEGVVEDVARFNLSLFNLRARQLSPIENKSIFLLIKASIAGQVTILQEEYEVDVQFNEDCQCLIVHKKHACFGDEVQSNLHLLLNDLLIISIRSQQIRQFNNLIRKELKNMPFLQQHMKNSRNETFLAINMSEMTEKEGKVNSKHLENFLKYFKLVVDQELQVKVFFSHIEQKKSREEIDRVVKVAEENNMVLKTEELTQRYAAKGVWKLKDLSEVVLPKRQRQLISFIKGLIVRDSGHEDPQELEEMVDSMFEEKSEMSLLGRSEVSSEQKSRIEQKGKLGWFTEEFKMPKLRDIEEEDKPFILGGRRRDLEKVFENNTRAKFKIWGLELSTKVQWPTQVENTPIFIRNPFKGRQFNDRLDTLNPNALPDRKMGVVAFMNKNIQLDFVPVLLLQRIG